MAGTFSNTVYFDRSTTGAFTKTSNGGLDAFLAKFDSNGNLVWIITFGGTSDDEAINVAINSLSEDIIAGTFTGTVTLI
ncbi:hypothetical protein OAD50_03655 [Vicingaceae bacterium]|nr:hypothetical protein [Vicingaceae bacterium]MDC1452573.1 hypothetical protein [Vicingaceae bacterium]